VAAWVIRLSPVFRFIRMTMRPPPADHGMAIIK
jgi:hypothetical protein